MFIEIVTTDEAFEWRPVDEKSGQPYASVFQLRQISDDVDQRIRKAHTTKWWDKGRRVEETDQASFAIALLDYAIVGWTHVKDARTGDELPCTAAVKARLPERWRVEIQRLCYLKEAGEVVARATQEKKRSTTTSASKPTPADTSSAV